MNKVYKIFVFMILLGPLSLFAQSIIGLEGLTMTISPDAPSPGGTVNFRIENYAIDLPGSDVVWYVGGIQKARGIGLTKFSTKVGALGSSNRITVIINTPEGGQLTKEVVLRPAFVDLLWQADSHTPRLYLGKALPTTKNAVTFYANPYLYQGGGRIDPSRLRYNWSLDFDDMPGESGIGRNNFKTKNVDLVGQTELKLRVSTLDGAVAAENRISLPPIDPLVLVYRVNDLSGTETHPLPANINMLGDEVRLRAEGYFFPESHLSKPGLSYKWTMNGKSAITDSTSPEILTIRRGDNVSGTAKIAVSVSDPFDTFITATRSYLISVGESGSTFQ